MSIDHIEELKKNIDHIEHVEKYNPYHGKDGRFTSKNGGGGGAAVSSGTGGNQPGTKTFSYNNKRCHATIIPGMTKDHLMGDEKLVGEMDGYDIYQLPSNGFFDQHGFIGIKKNIVE